MIETMPDNQDFEEKMRRGNRAAKLAYSIEELTKMLSDKLWDEPEYEDIKDRCLFAATLDACNAAATELSGLIG